MAAEKPEPSFLGSPEGIAASILAPALLGGGSLGYMASKTPERPGEDTRERRQRIIRHALAGALAGGGVGGLSNLALNQAGTAIPERTWLDKTLDKDWVKGTTTLGGALGGVGIAGMGKGLSDSAVKHLQRTGALGAGSVDDAAKAFAGQGRGKRWLQKLPVNKRAAGILGLVGGAAGLFGNDMFHRGVVPALQGTDGN